MRRIAAIKLAAVFVLIALGGRAMQVHAEPIAIIARQVPLDITAPERSSVGKLEYRGGLQLSADDRRFGGLSGLLVAADGATFIAVSDEGWLLTGNLVYDGAGWLAGVSNCTISALRSPKNVMLAAAGKNQADAESLARDGSEGFLVGFERHHRILRYPRPDARPVQIATPPGLQAAPENSGLESLTRLSDGRLLALSEGMGPPGVVVGWIGTPKNWQPLSWKTSGGFQPTDAATLPDGDLLVLERRFPPVGIRLRRVPVAALVSGAVLDGVQIARFEGSLTTDNMEAIATRRGTSGEPLVYLLSDDNYSIIQRTLLLMFRVVE